MGRLVPTSTIWGCALGGGGWLRKGPCLMSNLICQTICMWRHLLNWLGKFKLLTLDWLIQVFAGFCLVSTRTFRVNSAPWYNLGATRHGGCCVERTLIFVSTKWIQVFVGTLSSKQLAKHDSVFPAQWVFGSSALAAWWPNFQCAGRSKVWEWQHQPHGGVVL